MDANLQEYIERVVADAPPLTERQKDLIRAVFAGVTGEEISG